MNPNAPLADPADLAELLGIPFTPEQLAAITAPAAPGVIVAGAGSGKTTVMAARVVWLVGTGTVRPEQVLGLTFTNKAAGELAERVRKALGRLTGAAPRGGEEEPPGEPEISTYHAFAGRLLTDHGLRIGVEPTARLLADATRFQLAARTLREAPGPYPALTGSFSTLVADLLALDGELSEHLVTPDRLRAHDLRLLDELAPLDPARRGSAWVREVRRALPARLELTDLVQRYRAAKTTRGVLDFGDQIALAARLATTRPETGRLLREQYAVVLLDEYQDTSVAQRLLLAGLFGDGAGHPVTAVGDPCQAIYGWRGASVANLDDFPDHFRRADGRPAARYSLSENRRSGGRLLALANRIAEPLRALHEGVEALRPAPGAEQDGYLRCALLETAEDEIDWLAEHVAHRVRTGTPPGRIAVLCRAGRDFPDIQAALVARDVPVEVVGLSGLLHLPEVADLVAVCEVLEDPTANDALVRLLIGPRWRIGARDLALLGRRAAALVRVDEPGGGADARLAAAVAGTDPTETVSLSDALADPGDDTEFPFSPEARTRFARLAAELRELRRSLGDPLMDLLHRILATTGLDVELAASPHALAARRRETLGRFLDIAGGFADLDGDASLAAFLGFLRTAAQFDRGMDAGLPGEDDTVKVMTAHKAKGLEWEVVAVPGLVKGAFPSSRSRERWTRNAKVLPHELRGDAATLPEVGEWSSGGMKQFEAEMKEHQATEELRLGYVAFTRPKALLLASGHWWGPTQKKPRGPSEFLAALREHAERGAGDGEVEVWAPAPEKDAPNPLLQRAEAADTPWPLPLDPAASRARREAADLVLDLLHGPAADGPPEAPSEDPLIASWDRDLTALTEELRAARRATRDVPLPPTLSATALVRLAADPDAFAAELARPMPRRRAPAARRGTRFHAWVESRFEPLPLLGPDELPGLEGDDEVEDERDLDALKEAFLATPYAGLRPYRVEAPFQLRIAGRLVRGRIDAVYRTGTADGPSYEVVDWKTQRTENADPMQLAVYRLAWAEQAGVDPERVSAAFLYVRSGRIVRPEGLPGRDGLAALLSPGDEERGAEG